MALPISHSAARLWRVPLEADLHHRAWDGEHVFFHGAAGDTHRFSEAATLVLLRLMTMPSDESSLAALLADAAEVDQAAAQTALADILGELARLEFAEPAA